MLFFLSVGVRLLRKHEKGEFYVKIADGRIFVRSAKIQGVYPTRGRGYSGRFKQDGEQLGMRRLVPRYLHAARHRRIIRRNLRRTLARGTHTRGRARKDFAGASGKISRPAAGTVPRHGERGGVDLRRACRLCNDFNARSRRRGVSEPVGLSSRYRCAHRLRRMYRRRV